LTGNTLPIQLDLLRLFLLQPRPNDISVGGHVQLIDPPEPLPVTFTSGRAHIRIASPWKARDGGKLEFYFRTVSPTGLILNSGPWTDGGGSVSVELFDGRLYVNVDDGGRDGFNKYVLDGRSGRADDGQPHRVMVEAAGGVVWMSVDDSGRSETLGRPVDLRGAPVYLGGVGEQMRSWLPWHVWTRDSPSYLGCVWSVRFNGGTMVDLAGLIRDTSVPGGVEVGCRTMPDDCTPSTCQNEGVCSQRWLEPVCDCSQTAFTSNHCQLG